MIYIRKVNTSPVLRAGSIRDSFSPGTLKNTGLSLRVSVEKGDLEVLGLGPKMTVVCVAWLVLCI